MGKLEIGWSLKRFREVARVTEELRRREVRTRREELWSFMVVKRERV